MAAIETALAVTLLPHFIADTSSGLRSKFPKNQLHDATNLRLQELLEDATSLRRYKSRRRSTSTSSKHPTTVGVQLV
jgi:hypothetical protein